MALTGSMKDFGISEILQLIGQQKKSGTLTVKDKRRRVEILFDQGNIVSARHEPREDYYDLAAYLVRSGLLTKEQLEQAEKEQAETLKPLPYVLHKSGLLDLETIKEMVTLVHLETIYSLFLWTDGDYSFEQGPISYPAQWTQPISSEQVLMDGYRMKDEWPTITSVLPSDQVKLEKQEMTEVKGLEPEQKKLLMLVDGSRTVEDLIFLSRMGRFECMKALRDLVDKGLIRKAGARTEKKERERDLLVIFLNAACALIVLVGLVAIGAGFRVNLQRIRSQEISASSVQAREILWAKHRLEKIKNALGLYAAEHGAYPETLRQLVKEGLLEEDDLGSGVGAFDYTVEDRGRTCRVWLSGREELKLGRKENLARGG